MSHSQYSILFSARFGAAACAASFFSVQACFAYDEHKYQSLMQSATHHIKMVELEQSILDYSAAIKVNPTNYLAFQLMSESHRDLNMLPEAIADLTRAIALSPKMAGLYRDRGYIYFRNAQHKEAIADYTKAIALEPNDSGAYRSRGRNYTCLKQYRNAAADYKKSIEIKSKTSLRLEIETRGTLGDLYLKGNQDKEAMEQFNLLITRYPHVSKGYYGRSDVYKKLGKTDLSKKDLAKAHEIDYELDPGLKRN